MAFLLPPKIIKSFDFPNIDMSVICHGKIRLTNVIVVYPISVIFFKLREITL